MNLGRTVLVAAFLGAAALSGADEPNVELSGVLTVGGDVRLALTDKTTGVTQWVGPGERINGYKVERYDPAAEVVVMKRGNQESRLALTSGKGVINPPPTPGLAAMPVKDVQTRNAIATAVRNNLRTLANAARQYQLEQAVASATYADLVGPGKFISEMKPVAGEDYSTLTFSTNVTAVSATTADGQTVALGLTGAVDPVAGKLESAADAAPAMSQVTPTVVVIQAPTPASATPPAAEALAPTGRTATYTTRGDDTWQKVSDATGVSVPDLQRLNPAVSGSSLPANQAIRIR